MALTGLRVVSVEGRYRPRRPGVSLPRISPVKELISISVDELRERLDYDPGTGVLRWRKGKRIAGAIKPSGYRELEWWSVGGRGLREGGPPVYLRAHRVAWALSTGAWPPDEIDHRNGDRDDNRLANLRPATRAENAQNLVQKPRRSAPMVGVSKVPRCKNRWRAGMHRRYLGAFGSPEEAHQAYLAAKAKHHSFQPVLREA